MLRWFLLTLTLATPATAQDTTSLITAARTQVGVTVIYDPAYVSLAFPGGDVPAERGVCTDVVIRALRDAWGIDLQLAVNRDMKAAFTAYPPLWGLKTTDRNIDHRRVPNLQTLFTRIGAALPAPSGPAAFAPGDIVTFLLPGNLPHIGILSEKPGKTGPMVLHNIGAGAAEDDILFTYEITGHYRLTAEPIARLRALLR
ncbi:MAG: DUF1287 domain-containing protein [Paracoccaceae bacterium]